MPTRQNRFDIKAGFVFSLTVKTNSLNRVYFRAYDKINGTIVLINGRKFVDLLPVESKDASAQELDIRSEFIK